MWTSKIKKPSLFLLLTSLVLACGVHIYLTQEHLNLKYSFHEGSQLCNVSDYLNCSRSIASTYSEFLGIPLSIFGLFTNLLILFFVIRFLLNEDTHSQRTQAVGALSFSFMSVGASLVMAFISFGILKSLCPFCVASYILSFIIATTCWMVMKDKFVLNLGKQFTSLAVALLVFFAGSFVSGKIALSKYNVNTFNEMLELRLSDWQSKAPKEITPVSPMTMGPDSAKMKIVEFADFLCIHCKLAFPKLHLFLKTHSDVQLSFQAFPLDGCKFTGEQPGKRCQLAMLNYCANEQGKGWQTMEWLFKNQETNHNDSFDTILEKGLAAVSLDKDSVQSCMDKPETLETIRKQLKLGQDLGIQGTPGFFVNQKAFPGVGNLPALEAVYKQL